MEGVGGGSLDGGEGNENIDEKEREGCGTGDAAADAYPCPLPRQHGSTHGIVST